MLVAKPQKIGPVERIHDVNLREPRWWCVCVCACHINGKQHKRPRHKMLMTERMKWFKRHTLASRWLVWMVLQWCEWGIPSKRSHHKRFPLPQAWLWRCVPQCSEKRRPPSVPSGQERGIFSLSMLVPGLKKPKLHLTHYLCKKGLHVDKNNHVILCIQVFHLCKHVFATYMCVSTKLIQFKMIEALPSL